MSPAISGGILYANSFALADKNSLTPAPTRWTGSSAPLPVRPGTPHGNPCRGGSSDPFFVCRGGSSDPFFVCRGGSSDPFFNSAVPAFPQFVGAPSASQLPLPGVPKNCFGKP